MKRNIILSAIVMMFAVLTGCTHNEGDIGDMFGTWKITSIEVDGSGENIAPGNLFMAFQHDVVTVAEIPEHPGDDMWKYGRWERNGNELLLIFDMTDKYPLPAASCFVKGTNHCTIEKLNGKDFIFTNAVKNEGGELINYRYTLVHWK